jgi:mannose-6-phosphate isomerase class I
MSFNRFPSVALRTSESCLVGWAAISDELSKTIRERSARKVVIECYQGVFAEDILAWIDERFPQARLIESVSAFRNESEIRSLTHPNLTDDRIFGFITDLKMSDLIDPEKVSQLQIFIDNENSLTFVVGTGASLLVNDPDVILYADMARWEIQMRMRKKEIANIGVSNRQDPFETQYKRGFYLDWRLCDDLKKGLRGRWDYILDTNSRTQPKMISAALFEDAMDQTVSQPFSVVPFFDPGPWGGQWMKEKFGLDPQAPNYAWCFNCVPEENSLLLDINGIKFETPSINLVLFRPAELLGQKVRNIFGDDFPIRFDFLDTIGGGNLSLQVHPLAEYARMQFGMTYTQDESYYILDATENATVYLGLKEHVDPAAMMRDLAKAQSNGHIFDADKYAAKWPARKHDHFLIPAGTVHCSGEGCMVLEISATPYNFTFKLWDWGRMGLDGKPRPINIGHGERVIQWERQSAWVKENLINRVETLTENGDYTEEQTGLHQLQFIETRRYRHSGTVTHHTGDSVNVLMVVEGARAVVESPDNSFRPFHVNYAEAFIIPVNVKQYTIRPAGESEGKEIITIKAYVRT